MRRHADEARARERASAAVRVCIDRERATLSALAHSVQRELVSVQMGEQ